MDAIKAFLVEDSSIIRGNLVETLEENTPVQVVGTADSERGALAWLRDETHACDLVIVDIFLREGNGLGVLRGMKDLDAPPRRVVLSNHATPEVRSECSKLGAEKVFDKSNEIDEMLTWFSRLGPRRDSGRAAPAFRS